MAMFETEGFCPNNSFLHYGIKMSGDIQAANKIEKVLKVLEDRTGYMVYDPKMTAWGTDYPSIVELLLGDDTGIDIAKMLVQMIPQCKYAEVGKKTLIKDVISPLQIPGIYNITDKVWSFKSQDGTLDMYHPVMHESNRHLFTSDNFVSVVEDQNDQIVIWIFKYPN